MTRRHAKTKRSPETREARGIVVLAEAIGIPQQQIANGGFAKASVQNRTDEDQRAMMRSKQTLTVRRTTKMQQLVKADVLSPAEAKVCEWYLETWTAAYETSAITADYERAGGGNRWRVYCHSAKYAEQRQARREYLEARASISPSLVGLFEYVVLDNGPVGRRSLGFRVAVAQLSRHLAAMNISTHA